MSSSGNTALRVSTTRSRYGLRSGSGSISRRRRLQGEQSGRSGRGGDGGHNDNGGYNDDNGKIGDDGEDRHEGVGGMMGSGKCNGNIGSADSGMRRGGKGLILIPLSLIVSSVPSSAGDAPFHNDVHGGDANTNKDNDGVVVGSNGRNRKG